MSARLITVNDLYSFDPNHFVDIDKLTEIIGRHIEQPKEGLGFDNSPSAHMCRTISTPDTPLQRLHLPNKKLKTFHPYSSEVQCKRKIR